MSLNDFSGNNSKNNNNGNGGSFGGSIPKGIPFGPDDEIDAMEFLTDYNAKFATADPTMFRDGVIRQTESVLIGKTKPNALLIGEAGVGKTKIVEDIARRIANKDPYLPNKLQGMNIYELPLSNIVAGSSFVGQLEAKLKAVIDFATEPKNKAILFIDEIHQLVGSNETYNKMAQILKPALARGDIRVIGATTVQEAGNLMKDPAFNRRFTKIIVDELTNEQTVEILKGMKAAFFMHYNNSIALDDSTFETVVRMANNFSTAGSHRPDNAITLLDRACADAVIKRKEQEEAAKNDPTLLAAIQSVTLIPITEKRIRQTAIRLMSGNAKKETTDIDELKNKLSTIKGQDHVIDRIVERVRRIDGNLFPKKRPTSMIFAGASGVGKTEVCKILAEALTGNKPIILNMTEFHSSASINRIIGAPAGYVGSDSNAELPFDCLETNPYQVILLDEFEKCDGSVQTLFMSALEEGIIKTNRGKTIDFSKSIIIATTNASHTDKATTIGFAQSKSTSLQSTVSDLSKSFRTELIGRFGEIITFNNMSEDTYREIVQDIYSKEATRIISENTHITLPDAIPDNEMDILVKNNYVPSLGARSARKAVEAYIEKEVYGTVI